MPGRNEPGPLRWSFSEASWRGIAFPLVVLAYLGFLGFINALMFLPALGWLPDNTLSAMGHFGSFLTTGETHDLIHEFVFAFIVGTAAVGLLSQLWKPKESAVRQPAEAIAGQLVALIAWGTMILAALITKTFVPQPLFIIFGGLTLLATIFHPAGRGLFTWFSDTRINLVLLALVITAAVPLLALAFTNINLQRAGANIHQDERGEFLNLFGHTIPKHGGSEDEITPADMVVGNAAAHDQKHSTLGHYRNLAALSLIIILVGTLASLRPPGWRFTAWVAGGLPVLLGLASVLLPEAESSLGLVWGCAAIVWGTVFVAVAEFFRHQESKGTR